MSFWTYMLHCRGGYLYVGHTDDIERRMDQHERGIVPGFVPDHWPAKLVWACEGDLIAELAKGKSSPSTSSGRTGW